VESVAGRPTSSNAASSASVMVSAPTMPNINQSVSWPKRRRSPSLSRPSWAIALEGASTPVASAKPSGIASSAAPSQASPPPSGPGVPGDRPGGAAAQHDEHQQQAGAGRIGNRLPERGGAATVLTVRGRDDRVEHGGFFCSSSMARPTSPRPARAVIRTLR